MKPKASNNGVEKQGREAAKARKKLRRDDADARVRANKANAPATSVFKDAMGQIVIKKRAAKLAPTDKLIFNAVETNKRRH